MEKEKLLKLNAEQIKAVEVINTYLKSDNTKKYITISGPGGSGKTFMLKEALKKHNPQYILGTTISHFAKKVLSESLGSNFRVTTVAAMLGMTVDYDDETGEMLMVQRTDKKGKPIIPLISSYDIIIIDEASMIDDKLYNIILSYGKKIIAVGDMYQLPPVEQDHDSKFFDSIDIELLKIMRFNALIKEFSTLFITEIKRYNDGYNIDKNIITKSTGGRVSKLDDTGSGYIFLKSIKTVLTLAYLDFKRDPISTDGCRIIAYKNKTIDALNNNIRKMLFGKNRNVFEVGELVISDGGYGKEITNGDIFRVTGVKNFEDKNGVHCHILQLNKKLLSPVFVVSARGMETYDELESYYKQQAISTRQWKKYYEFINTYAKFKYSYAISVHKAQGSSIKNVYVFEGEIMGVKPITIKEKFQSLYVAVTRARHRVYIYNKTNSVDNSLINIKKNMYLDENTKNISK